MYLVDISVGRKVSSHGGGESDTVIPNAKFAVGRGNLLIGSNATVSQQCAISIGIGKVTTCLSVHISCVGLDEMFKRLVTLKREPLCSDVNNVKTNCSTPVVS